MRTIKFLEKVFIIVKTEWEGFHYWDNAPEEVSFLRNPHRHIFKVVATLPVEHKERELEFFMVKQEMDSFISNKLVSLNASCETYSFEIASFLLEKYNLPIATVEVYEDGENGAYVSLIRYYVKEGD
jgi:hypothetical protein